MMLGRQLARELAVETGADNDLRCEDSLRRPDVP